MTGFSLIGSGSDVLYNDIWRYNINQNQWDSIGIMPGLPRANALFGTFDSIILGGYGLEKDTLGNEYFGTDKYLYRYHVKSNRWDTLACVNFPDSIADGNTAGCFKINQTGYFYGGYQYATTNEGWYNNMWSFDASKFIPPDTPTGIAQVKSAVTFSVYPNPASHERVFSVSTSESGEIMFYDALGRSLDERKLVRGINQVKFHTDDEVVFYRATLSSGATQNGKVVFIR